MCLPQVAESILMSFSIAFTEPTFHRALVLAVGAILSKGRRTVTAMLWTMGDLAVGDPTSYHRVFSRAPWSPWMLGKVLATLVVELIPEEWIVVAIDDTTAQHRGKKVYGKGCHHDAVRSSHAHTVYKWGHKWVVLAIVVKLPFCSRPWALPVLAVLYRPEELNLAEGRRHKTPAQLARGLMAALMHWFPGRKFVFLGDGGYASHELASFCHRHRRKCCLVSRFHRDAALYDPPPKNKNQGRGRPRTKGRKRKSPEAVVATGRLKKTVVQWYGASQREVKVLSGSGLWYRIGQGLVPVEWVFVRDVTGTRRDEYFYCTQPSVFTAAQIVSYYTQRWTIEVTFQELRVHLGFETTRQRVAPSVLRMAPCLMGLFSVITLIYHEHLKRHEVELSVRPAYKKSEPTFSDAIATVRRLFWSETFFQQPYFRRTFKNIPPKMRSTILTYLSQAV